MAKDLNRRPRETCTQKVRRVRHQKVTDWIYVSVKVTVRTRPSCCKGTEGRTSESLPLVGEAFFLPEQTALCVICAAAENRSADEQNLKGVTAASTKSGQMSSSHRLLVRVVGVCRRRVRKQVFCDTSHKGVSLSVSASHTADKTRLRLNLNGLLIMVSLVMTSSHLLQVEAPHDAFSSAAC